VAGICPERDQHSVSGRTGAYLDERATDRRVSIANAEHTLEVTSVEQGISAQVTFTEYGLTLGVIVQLEADVIVQLEADGLRVEVPFNSIREENPEFRLGQIFLYPFLGATRGSSIPGYMLLPDGTGSLIPFADTTRATNMFYGRYYGPDAGMFGAMPYNPRVTDPYPIAYPVFGMAHGEGENAYLSLVEQGAAYGELQVHPAGSRYILLASSPTSISCITPLSTTRPISRRLIALGPG